jgi:Ca2+-binding RTX toxin-like protein
MPRTLGLLVAGLIACLSLTAFAAVASARKASHKGWPKINGDLVMHKADESGPITATKLDKHNELLGGHGDDVITAGNAGDVIWGDYKPFGQPTTQVDRLTGGAGRDFVYAGHGTNHIDTGAGRDVVHAHYGSGDIRCHSRRTIVYISHKARPHYKLTGCHRISYKTEAQRRG